MFRNALLASSAVVALAAASAPAHADNVGLNTWYAFDFAATGSPLVGGGVPGTSPAGVAAPDAPWTITLSSPATLHVTDVEIPGDQFTFFDNGVLLGTTSNPTPDTTVNVGECISCALASNEFSHGTFTLGAGTHSLTGVQDGVINFGDGDFEITTGVPEPTSWALMLLGFGGMGAAIRSRRRAVVSAA